MTDKDFSFAKQKQLIDELFAGLLKRYSISDIYEMDILELLRLTNLEREEKINVKKSNSFFDLMK